MSSDLLSYFGSYQNDVSQFLFLFGTIMSIIFIIKLLIEVKNRLQNLKEFIKLKDFKNEDDPLFDRIIAIFFLLCCIGIAIYFLVFSIEQLSYSISIYDFYSQGNAI